MSASISDDLKQLDFYESAFHGLTEGILWTDSHGTIVYSNEPGARWLGGHSKALLPGLSIYSLIPGAELKHWIEKLELAQNENSPLTFVKENFHFALYAVVRVTIGKGKYNCFLIKEEGTGGKDPNEMLRIISEGTASVIGGDFFRSLAYHVILSTGIRYAIITECANVSKTRLRTLVYVEHDHFLDNFEYDLSGTPCEIVMKGENYYCTADLDALFPKEQGIKAYFGVPIFLSNGEVIGHIAIFDTKAMVVSEQKLNVLKIFASRAGAEIERKRKDELIRDNMLRYKTLFEGSPIGLGEEDLSEIKKYTNELKQKHNRNLSEIFEMFPDEINNCYQRLRRLNANRAQVTLFELETEDQYLEYLQKRFQPVQFKDVILTFDSGETTFEREIEIRTAAGNKRHLKAKRKILPGSETDWAKTILTCVDITEQKLAQDNLKSALFEVKELKEKLEAENIYLQQEIKYEHNFDEIVSQAPIFKKVLDKIRQVAQTDATVLILGESGTGKELIARAIHSNSKRGKRPLVKINCAALPANLIESELFGHEKGSFTGAITQKIGRFELANGGTIFLDELGEMPLELQAKLLRVLQEGEFERVGGTKTLQVDARVIAATNRDLETCVNNKEFRADLYYRLNVFPIYSPPLRERKDDIILLVNHFCKKYGLKLGRKVNSISRQVLDTLAAYDWPGNIRELENVIERGLIVTKSNVLEPGEWLPLTPKPVESIDETTATSKSLSDIERQHIIDVMNQVNWKVRGDQGAARILNINPTTLEARMKKLGIERPR